VVSGVDLFFLSMVGEEGSAVVFPWGFPLVQVVSLAGLQRVLEWLARISKSWQGSGVKVLPLFCLWTWVVSGTHYVDIVGHDDDGGLKVTDPQRLTMSNLKETELRS